MYLLVLYFPLIGAIIGGGFGRFLGNKGSGAICVSMISLSCLCSWVIFYEVGISGVICTFKVGSWMESGILSISWGFLFDSITAVMLIVVTTVSLFVHIFSLSYMESDPHFSRFMSYLSLFTLFMLILVTADNYCQMFMGWEGVGLASYLLINFWYTRVQANKAAIKAIIVNRIGDFGLVMGILIIFYVVKSLDFHVVFAVTYTLCNKTLLIFGYEINWITLAGFFLFLGAVGKSAQLGLHTWLPDAMEGPTPVSALIHAATMVTAGVFVIVRSSPLLEYSRVLLVVISIVGGLTAFFAATVGVFQNDIKKVIAYSTCSQLGYMVFACGLSQYSVGMFHLTNHAFFKALLFLSAGSIIHALLDEQDMRRMGGLARLLPFTYVCFLIGSLAITGFPFLSGFYSKDLILELSYANIEFEGAFCYWFGVLSAALTSFYSFRIVYLTFLGESNVVKGKVKYISEGNKFIVLPMFFLALGSIFVGYLFKDMFVGMGTDFWGNSIFSLNDRGIVLSLEVEFEEAWVRLLPVICSILGGLLSLILYHVYIDIFYKYSLMTFFRKVYYFLSKKWFFDIVYNYFINNTVLRFGYNVIIKVIDRGFIEILGPTGIVRNFLKFSEFLKSLQDGKVYRYGYIILISVLFILSLNFLMGDLYCSYDVLIILSISFVIYIYILYKK